MLADSYISVIEAIKHSAYFHGKKPIIEWLNAEKYDGGGAEEYLKKLNEYDGIIVPGGFGDRGWKAKSPP